MLSLTRQLYNDFKSVYKISRIADPSIFPKVVLIIAPILNPYAIPYSSAAKILRVIHLHFIDNQCIIFALLIALVRQIT